MTSPRSAAESARCPLFGVLGLVLAIGGCGGAATSPPGDDAGTTGGATGSGGADDVGSGGRTGGGTGGGTGGATGGAPSTGGNGSGGGVSSTGGRVGTGGTGGTMTSGTGGAAGGAAGGAGLGLWIAPDGLDTNPGTEAMPLKTLAAASARAAPGTTIWVKAGTYPSAVTVNLNKAGTEAAPYRILAAPGARPVFDFAAQPRGSSAARGFALRGDYWHIKGVDVINAGDNCIHISGSHNTIEWVVTHGCDDTGIQITVDSSLAGDATRGAYNTILNCDSYENYDSTTGGENADGFAAKLYIGPGNVFRGCRAWNNSDDGWDFFASNDAVVLDGCWAFSNGKTAAGATNPNGDGNGFKLGGAPTAGDVNMGGAIHQVTGCFAFENLACGFVRNNNTMVPVLSMCGGRADPKGEYCSLTNTGAKTFTMTAAQAKAVPRNADGSLPPIN
ncbi:MAG: right-handed parallel beta-helix repeat-containing protein [Pseudomonadota bacterium]